VLVVAADEKLNCGEKSSEKPVNLSRRNFLTKATSVIGGVGLAYAAFPFLASWQPSARALAAGAPVEADISKLKPGEQVIYEWRGRPVFIVHRTPAMLDELSKLDDRLRDPNSDESEQPIYAKNIHRSIKPEYLVLVGICTHLGCTPLLKPEIGTVSASWPGGYFCPCHGSGYDMAGRVFKDVPAPINLPIPPYKFIKDKLILIGVDEQESV
jgi:ubiquinol-cytochrome c reductase iron-sulfur subunit